MQPALRAITPDRRPCHADPVRVLVADDNADVRLLVRMTLALDGDDLQQLPDAVDGVAALAAWRQDRPDVLVLDQRMPGLTGLDVARIVLAEEPEAAIALFSASLDPGATRLAASLGVTCVAKGDVARLPGIVRDLAAVRRLRRTA